MTDLARLRRCARILRRAHPHNTYRVSVEHRTIFSISQWAGIHREFSQSLDAWEDYAAEISEAKQ